MTTINIAEGKRDFSRLIRERVEKQEEVIVTRRGTPVAVLISYDAYRRLKREFPPTMPATLQQRSFWRRR